MDQKTEDNFLGIYHLVVGQKRIFGIKSSEVNSKRVVGAYKPPPFKQFIQSPISLVLKSNGDTRLIFHLSWPKNGNSSVNFHTPRDLCTVKCNDLDKAVRLCMKYGKNCYMVKSYMKSAFRHLPIRKQGWCWLVIMARHPTMDLKYYFAEKCLPFGHSISCSHFQRVSNGIQAIFMHRTGHRANNYLDDFLFVAWTRLVTNQLVEKFLEMCKEINFPIAMDKNALGNYGASFSWNAVNYRTTSNLYTTRQKEESHKVTDKIVAS